MENQNAIPWPPQGVSHQDQLPGELLGQGTSNPIQSSLSELKALMNCISEGISWTQRSWPSLLGGSSKQELRTQHRSRRRFQPQEISFVWLCIALNNHELKNQNFRTFCAKRKNWNVKLYVISILFVHLNILLFRIITYLALLIITNWNILNRKYLNSKYLFEYIFQSHLDKSD